MTGFCVHCEDERGLREEKRRQSLVVKEERIEFDAVVAVCEACGETVFDKERDERILREAYDLYRKRAGLLTGTEIRQLRERYGLSQRALAALLDWGQVTIQRYEAGAIQGRAHDEVLRSLQDPRRVLHLVATASARLSSPRRQNIRRAALSVLSQERSSWLVHDMDSLLGAEAGTRENGFRAFSIYRFAAAVVWFAARLERPSKTKLAKLLWLSDFKHFRDHGVSLTGLVYARLPYGPAPHRFQLLLGAAEELGALRIEPETFGPYVGDAVVVDEEGNADIFGADEIVTLQFVLSKFGMYSATDLSELTHREQTWLKRSDGQFIPYSDAHKLSMFE